jgi:hypothetical protein
VSAVGLLLGLSWPTVLLLVALAENRRELLRWAQRRLRR